MSARIHVLKALKPSPHYFLFVIIWILRIIGRESVEERPGELSEFLSIERTIIGSFNIFEVASEPTEWTLFADGFVAIVFVLFEHSGILSFELL